MHLLVTLVGLMTLLPFLAVQIAGAAKILSGVVDRQISYDAAVLICVASIWAYVHFGGARAVVWTDGLQGIIVAGILGISAWLFVDWAGGVSSGLDRVARAMPEKLVFNRENGPQFLDQMLSWTFAVFLFPHIFQRLFMARAPETIRRTSIISGAIMLVMMACILVMAIFATAELHGTLDDPDELIVAMYRQHWREGGVILMIAVLALSMSTIDSVVLSVASLATRDTLRGQLRIDLSAATELSLARWISLALLALASLVALQGIGRDAIAPWVTLGASFCTLLLWPLIGSTWARGTAAAAIAGMAMGFVAICLARFTHLCEGLPFGFATCGFLVGGTCFLGTCLLQRQPVRS
ncbi:sodium:solute symporter family transporter [Paralimibaculum aggregatum]|uniref:sodium:solute symporter family transporter n=1 Tax=Paralimibaculum aggregatum TaxID=3036245 RepID=UPI00255551EC|nr:hypothetical protein [Limibaculum sp. NKW23]